MDFCDQCESTQRGSVGPSSSQLMCLKGNYHWCCFPFLSGQRASRSCHCLPATQEESSSVHSLLPTRHLDSRKHVVVGQQLTWGKDNQVGWLNLICPPLGNLSLELIVNPIKAGNTAYWFTPLNTHNKQIHWEYITCKSTHKWFSRPQNIHINYSSSCHYAGVVGEKQLVLTLS